MIKCKVCGKEYSPKVYGLHIQRCKPKEIKIEKDKTEEKNVEENINLEDMTVKELREIAKEKEIEGYSNMKKDELIDAIKEVI